MRNQEMLEKAAKAVGYQLLAIDPDAGLYRARSHSMDDRRWNPLIDDGDALRLAIDLRMTIRLEDPAAVVVGWAENQHVPFTRDGKGPWFWKEWGRPLAPHATTRRAIVRAAAEIAQSDAGSPSSEGSEPDGQ